MHDFDQSYDCYDSFLESNLSAVQKEHDHYRDLLTRVHGKFNRMLLNVVFDFTEKVLLSQLVRKAGQLFSVEGWKVELLTNTAELGECAYIWFARRPLAKHQGSHLGSFDVTPHTALLEVERRRFTI